MNFFKKYKYFLLFSFLLLLFFFFFSYNIFENFNNFNLKDKNDNSITVILNIYKRPHTLIEQINAVNNQTIPPEKIIIYKNYAEGIVTPYIPNNLKENITIIESSENFGVWARFAIGFLANTEYICVFDDDTIPGNKWFENCINTMKKTPGLLGTNGIIFKKGVKYEAEENVGWHFPNVDTREVDIVGHSWFFKRKWLVYLWEIVPNFEKFLKSGEDIAFSTVLQKHNIKTYVPPHPKEDKTLWGSLPELGNKYGSESVGISVENNNKGYTHFDDALKYFIEYEKFVTIKNR